MEQICAAAHICSIATQTPSTESGGTAEILSSALSSLNTWHHVAVTFNKTTSTATVYINGGPAGSDTTSTIVSNTNELAIARNIGGKQYFDGLLDDVRIYNRVLSPSEIVGLVAQPTPTPTPTNAPPTANAGPDQSANVNSLVTLNGSGSDPNGDPLTYAWNFGDGSTGSPQAATTHTYTQVGTYTATLTVNDGRGGVTSDAAIITITGSTKFKVNDAIRVFTGGGNLNVRSAPNGTLLGTQPNGAQGTIIGGPNFANNLWWWNVNFNTGIDGWAAENYLVLSSGALTPTLDQITLTATRPSGQQVSGVQFYLDNQPYGNEDTSSPYTAVVTLSSLAAGTHTMKATFRNSAGQLVDTQTFTFSATGPVAMSMDASASTLMAMPDTSASAPSQLASIAAAIESLKAMLARLQGQ